MKKLALAFLLLPYLLNAAVPATGPDAEFKKDMDSLFEASKKVNSKNAAEKSEARAKLDGALDWERIAKDCLGPAQWKKQSAGNREEFRKLLKDVIIRTAYTRLDKFWPGTTYTIDAVDLKKGFFSSKFKTSSDAVVLDYYIQKKGAKWIIYDIAYEGERYSVNINQQIDSFMKEQSFPKLLEKLKKRRDDLVAEEANPKPEKAAETEKKSG